MLCARRGPLAQGKRVKVHTRAAHVPTHWLEPQGKHSAVFLLKLSMTDDLEEKVHSHSKILDR